MKILIIRFSSIGDIVLTTPVIRALKTQLDSAEIHYLTKQAYSSILSANPYVDRIHEWSEEWKTVIALLRTERFDLVVDLHHNARSLRVKLLLGRKSVSFHKINLEKWLMVMLKWNLMPVAHIVDRYMDTVRHLHVLNDGKGLDYYIPAGEEIGPGDLPLTHVHGYGAIAIGGNHNTKKLPKEKLLALVRKLSFPVILIGGKEDTEVAEFIRASDPVKVFNGCGRFTLNQSASVLKHARLVISHDTGAMHMAAAFGKPIISIWGNTIPAFGMTPYYGHTAGLSVQNNLFEVNGLWCRPCSKLGYRKCPLGHFKCMNHQDLERIAAIAAMP